MILRKKGFALFQEKQPNLKTGKFPFYPSHFCGKQVNQIYLGHKRKNPADPKSFHPICDVCNQAYLEKAILGPYLANTAKLQKAINTRKYDCDALMFVAEEVDNTVSKSRNSSINEDDTKVLRLEQQKMSLTAEVHDLTKDIQAMSKEERSLNEEIRKLEKAIDEKSKRLNNM